MHIRYSVQNTAHSQVIKETFVRISVVSKDNQVLCGQKENHKSSFILE